MQNKLISKIKLKNATTNVPEKYAINVKMKWTRNIDAKDKIYAPCILLSRLNFRFDGNESSVTELPNHLQNRRSKVKLSYTIRSIPYLRHNIINKIFDRLALLYKIISQNSKTISALFQPNHISKYFQIMK